ncbi:HD domain-containing protein [Evansella halocellulosilytica]|uniref:HD domain-containing protein n=1 Tax=Evansella halocellulosilytica TaxID=2011013 RepID=UPI000BB86437|nr:HD domain-containing protein [Evansella halocellulosilytica]
MYIFNNEKEIYDPFYETSIKPYPWEFELLHSKTVRRLKGLSHYGTGSYVTSAKHSRYEHTVGVWTIISTFFPKKEELRLAALLHDIGHLPFSHAVERTLNFNHHDITEEKIQGEEISSILRKYDFSPERITHILNEDSPLAHKTSFLSADHLDSFLRDCYMLGKMHVKPSSILKNISFSGNYVEADLETSKHIMSAIYEDHKTFLHPVVLALDALLAKAIFIFTEQKKIGLQSITSLTNHELLQQLRDADLDEVNEILTVIMLHPEKITIQDGYVAGAEKVEVSKVYDKTPLVDGTPLCSLSYESEKQLDDIRSFVKRYYFSY